jgi:phytoene synthase
MRAPATATLTAYCTRVAGVPGRMCLAVLGWRGAEADAFADAAGIAVQLTNILRDVDEDAVLGRLYVPREALLAAGIVAVDPGTAVGDPRFGRAWLAIALLAEARFAHAETLRPALAMLAIYRSLLAKLRRRGWRHRAPRVTLPAWRKLLIAARVLMLGA